MARQPSHAHCCEEVEPIDRDRLALALHTNEDCAFLFGRECDCSMRYKLDEAFARYDDFAFPPPRDKDEW